MAEAYATIGVEPTVSMEDVISVYHAKIKYAHPDSTQDPEERKVREDRTREGEGRARRVAGKTSTA